MAIIITGASGQFGRATAERLLSELPASELILTTRKPASLADLAARGAQVRYADFDDESSLPAAFSGGRRMLLISTARVGSRVQQHANAIRAAVAAGVAHITYTSVLGAAAPGNPAIVTLDHRATEKLIENSGARWTILRDSQYSEAVAGAIVPAALSAGGVPDNSHDGRIAFVSREDCVACACAALLRPEEENEAYDITGPELLSIPLAIQLASKVSGVPIQYKYASDEEMFAYFDGLGVPRHASDTPTGNPIPWSSDDMVSFGRSIREGYFNVLSDSVEKLTGRKPRSLLSVFQQFAPGWKKSG